MELGVRSVVRATRILQELSKQPKGLDLVTLSKSLSIPKSSAYYIVETLKYSNFVIKDERGRYFLGIEAFKIGSCYLNQLHINDVFHKVANGVVKETGETVQLALLDNRNVVYAAKEEGTQPVRLVSQIGKSLPAHTTALGKILLAYLTPDVFESLYPDNQVLEKLTEKSINTVQLLKEELKQIYKQGYAQDCEETALDLQCFAAPVVGENGKVIFSISISVPNSRVSNERRSVLIKTIIDAAHQISYLMGAPQEPYES